MTIMRLTLVLLGMVSSTLEAKIDAGTKSPPWNQAPDFSDIGNVLKSCAIAGSMPSPALRREVWGQTPYKDGFVVEGEIAGEIKSFGWDDSKELTVSFGIYCDFKFLDPRNLLKEQKQGYDIAADILGSMGHNPYGIIKGNGKFKIKSLSANENDVVLEILEYSYECWLTTGLGCREMDLK